MKKKAFTLTELLVVVVIMGVLSAVVLPKFTKVLQTRKTTEAENVMGAVRNEQEARCMVGRNYTADTTKLASLPKATSKNYTYSLGAQGITATAKDGNYTLQIPSYTDGRICCSGAGCERLNKNYPKCGEIPNLETAICEAPTPIPQCDVPSETTQTFTQTCGCTSSGTKTATSTFDEESCAWSDWDWGTCSEKETDCPACTPGTKRNTSCSCGVETGQQCSASGMSWESYTNGTCALTQTEKDTCSCEPKPNTETRKCETGTGTQTRSYSCQSGHWVAGDWEGRCAELTCEPEKLALETICTPSEGYPYGCGLLKMKYDCDVSTGKWVRNTSKETCQETTHCYCSYGAGEYIVESHPYLSSGTSLDTIRMGEVSAWLEQRRRELETQSCTLSGVHVFGQSPSCITDITVCGVGCAGATLRVGQISYRKTECTRITDYPYPITLKSGYGYTNWGMYSGN